MEIVDEWDKLTGKQENKHIMKRFLIVIFFFSFPIYGRYSPALRLNGHLDQLIWRLASCHDLEIPQIFYDQPVDYGVVYDFLLNASSRNLSNGEKNRLVRAMKYYNPGLGLIKWSNSEKDIHFRIHLGLLGDLKPGFSDSTFIGIKGIFRPTLTGNINKFSFYSSIDVWTEYRSDTLFNPSSYEPYEGVPYNLYGRGTLESHVRSSDLPRGGIRYDGGWVTLETAIDYIKMGPAVHFPLTMSGNTPPITYFRASADLDLVKYSHTAGLLKSQKDKRKYLYIHRLSSKLLQSRLDLAINEVIIYGSTTTEPLNDSNQISPIYLRQQRGWEWTYLIPFVPFKFVEHYAGDKDNAAISFDMNLRWPANFRWYMEFFLDDILSPWKIFSDDLGNKWALTAGMQYFGTIWNRDLMLGAEYSRVEPWVYTHFYGRSHNFLHFDKCLGSPLGPNSQAIVASAMIQLNRINEIGIGFTHIGRNQNVRGGKITDIFQHQLENVDKFSDSTKKQFLGKGTEWFLRPALLWNFNPFGRFFIDAKGEIDVLHSGHFAFSFWGGLVF